MSDKLTVLVVGVTGRFGSVVTNLLLAQPNIKVKALVRSISPSDEKKQEALKKLEAQGVELVEGTITDKQSVSKAVVGSDVVVVGVTGGDNIILDGQKNVIDAAAAGKVKYYFGSTYALNPTRLTPKDSPILYRIFEVDQYAKSKGLKFANITNGLWFEFYQWFFINHQTKQYEYYGDKDAHFQGLSIVDTAKYVTAIISKPERWDKLPEYIHLTAEMDLSYSKIEKVMQEERDPNFKMVRAGSTEDAIQKYLEAYQEDPTNLLGWFVFNELSLINNKKTSIDKYLNYLIPEVKPITFKEFLQSSPDQLRV